MDCGFLQTAGKKYCDRLGDSLFGICATWDKHMSPYLDEVAAEHEDRVDAERGEAQLQA